MMQIRKTNTILLPLESYLYLQDRGHIERCGKHRTEKQIERLKRNFEEFSYNGYKQVMDGDLGGGVNGRWTSWSCEDMKKILDRANLPYKDGKETECVDVSL